MSGRLGSVTLERLQESLHSATARISRTLACLLLATAVALAATGFLSAALYLALDERLTSTAAAALVGGLLLALALVLLLVANRGIGASRAETGGACAAGTRQRPGDAAHCSPSELAASLGAVVGDETVNWTRAHPFSALAAALVAGIAVGVSPRLRSELEQLMGALSGKGEPGKREP